jgi:hypothetical protein
MQSVEMCLQISVFPIRLHSVVRVYLTFTFQRSADKLIN